MSQKNSSIKKMFLSVSLLSIAPGAFAENKVVYGEDDRRELFEEQNETTKGLADSTVVLMYKTQLTAINSDLTGITADNYSDYFNLCPTERYYAQKSAGFCSGFLVAPDLIVTAGHCITSDYSCAETSFAFGYAMKDANTDLSALPTADIYSCQSIVSRKQEYAGSDYAVVKLDRPVVGHNPLKVRRQGAPAVNDGLTVIGYPAGIPMKIGTGKVRDISATGYFQASLDTYVGNSGSAVLNSTTGEVEGILVRGEVDFVSQGSCNVSNVCTETGCRGEDVSRIADALPFIPE